MTKARSVVAALTLLGLAKAAMSMKLALFNGGSLFFEPIEEGWFHRCSLLGITCYSTKVTSPETADECLVNRKAQIDEWIDMGVTGVAIKPCSDKEAMREMFDEFDARGLHLTTFDSDVNNSARAAYIGTDNEFMGRTMAKLLRQLKPHGGTYVWVGWKIFRGDGFVEEIERYNDRDDRAHWHEAVGPTEDYLHARQGENYTKFHSPIGNDFMPVMERAAKLNPTAIVFFKQTPMRHENYTQFVDENRHRDITLIGTDGSDFQLAYLNSRYIDGLVGQLPYEMGTESAQVLFDLITTGMVKEEYISTNIVAYNLIPLELPALDVDENLAGDLKILGYVCFSLVALSIIACTAWTMINRNEVIVRAAQPFFLYMVAAGVFVMSGSMIPLTFDDGGEAESLSHTKSVGICMSVPWLAFIGFTVTFSALFSKLWRVNRLMGARDRHAPTRVSEKDVLAPFFVLLMSNIAVLTCWTIIDPLKYTRREHTGTDYWNRVLSTYGTCRSENVVAYLLPLAGINFLVIAIAGWQAVQARSIQAEFSEAKYIGLAVGALFQAFLTGIPVIVVVRDQPEAYYVVLTMIIFVLCEVLLMLIFLPKVFMQRKYGKYPEEEQKRMLGQRIRQDNSSNVGMRNSDGTSSYPDPSRQRDAGGSSVPTVSERLASVQEDDEASADIPTSSFDIRGSSTETPMERGDYSEFSTEKESEMDTTVPSSGPESAPESAPESSLPVSSGPESQPEESSLQASTETESGTEEVPGESRGDFSTDSLIDE